MRHNFKPSTCCAYCCRSEDTIFCQPEDLRTVHSSFCAWCRLQASVRESNRCCRPHPQSASAARPLSHLPPKLWQMSQVGFRFGLFEGDSLASRAHPLTALTVALLYANIRIPAPRHIFVAIGHRQDRDISIYYMYVHLTQCSLFSIH